MKRRYHEFLVVALLLTVTLIVHHVLRNVSFSYVPAPLILATLLAWLLPNRWHWPILLAVGTELLSSLPFGVFSLVIALPFLVWRFRGTVENSSSFSFFALLIATNFLQFSVLIISSLWSTRMVGHSSVVYAIPWQPLLVGTFVSALMGFALCRILEAQTRHVLPVVALSHIRYGRSFDR